MLGFSILGENWIEKERWGRDKQDLRMWRPTLTILVKNRWREERGGWKIRRKRAIQLTRGRSMRMGIWKGRKLMDRVKGYIFSF